MTARAFLFQLLVPLPRIARAFRDVRQPARWDAVYNRHSQWGVPPCSGYV